MRKQIHVLAPIVLSVSLLILLSVSSATTQGIDDSGSIEPADTTNPTTMLYQGYVTVDEEAYDGTGYFKFAIVNAAGNVTYWSNDNTSSNGSEPSASVSLQVDKGYFTVALGDTSLSGMSQALSPSVFPSPGRHLRVWFAQSASGSFTPLSLIPITAAPYALNAETLDGKDSSAFSDASHDHWGEIWSGSGSGLVMDGEVYNGATLVVTNTQYDAIWGRAIDGDWSAGVVGHSHSDSHGMGVQGLSYATTGEAYGVWAAARAPEGAGVYGVNTGGGYGGYFTSTTNAGVYGTSPLTGVVGVATEDTGIGVYGSGGTCYPFGPCEGAGVYGESSHHGVEGISFGEGNVAGVYGSAIWGDGIYGISYGPGRSGVYGKVTQSYTNTAGLKGLSSANSDYATWGVYGQSNANGGAGVMAYNYWYGAGLRAQSYGGNIIEGYSGDPFTTYEDQRFRVENDGDIYADGDLYLGGTKSSVVRTTDREERRLYAIESPEVWFEDFGSAQLLNGKATISIDPLFAQTVNLTETYHVFVTPISDEPVLLFVTNKHSNSFTVQGVTLDSQPTNATFDYRIVAKRLEYEDVRLEPVGEPQPTLQPSENIPRPEPKWPAFPPDLELEETIPENHLED